MSHSERLSFSSGSSSTGNFQSQDNVMQSASGHTLSTTNDTTPLFPVFSPEQLQLILPFSIHYKNTTISGPAHHNSGIQTRLQTGVISRKNYASYLATLPEITSLDIMGDFSSGFSFLANVNDIEKPKNFKVASINTE